MQKNLSFLVFALLAAACAGAAAAVLVSQSLERYAQTLLDDRRFAAFVQNKNTQIPTTLEESLISIQEAVVNSVVLFVDEDLQTQGVNPVQSGNEVVRGEGMIVSADGWILTTREQLAAYQRTKEGYAGFAVLRAGELFQVERVIEDTQTTAIAVQVQGASGWTPIEFAQSDEVLPGATVFGIGTLGEVVSTSGTYRGTQAGEGSVPAEEPRALWTLSHVLSPGTPVLSAQKKFFGWVTEAGDVLPAQSLRPFVRQALRGAEIVHAGFGAYVFDLAQPSSLSPEDTQGYTAGALILAKAGERTAIIKSGPADSAGLTDGDIILAINDIPITGMVTCADILATYAPEQTLTLRVARGGEVKDLELTLGTWEELIY